MKIFAVQFDYGSSTGYEKLAAVLQYSVKKYAPKAEFVLWHVEAPKQQRENKSFDSNHYKLMQWCKFVEQANDDVILTDCDMFIMNDITTGFNSEFDIGLCVRRRPPDLPWNGGVVFVRNTDSARAFIKRWGELDTELFGNKIEHYKYRNNFGGMNQSSLGKLLSVNKISDPYAFEAAVHDYKVKMKGFPCSVWNACVEHWDKIDPVKTMIVHVKSGLRKSVTQDLPTTHKLAAGIWYKLAAECGVSQRGGAIQLYHYDNYDQYIACQKKRSENKKDAVWVNKFGIVCLARHIKKKINPAFIICHGTRSGAEQKYFLGIFPKAQVIGTEIADYAKDIPNTVQHDFNLPRPGWTGKADLIYSNAFDHAFEPNKTLMVWLAQLKQNGVLIIEHSDKHQKLPSSTDPFSFSVTDFTQYVHDWTHGKYRVTMVVAEPNPPHGKGRARSNIEKFNVKYIFIERSLNAGEELEAARAKAMGRTR